jgi:hypothetical protein
VDAAETLDVPVVLDTMSAQAKADAKVLFYALAFACRGVAGLILRRVSTGNGLEAWRQLHKRFSVGTSSTALSTLQAIMTRQKESGFTGPRHRQYSTRIVR